MHGCTIVNVMKVSFKREIFFGAKFEKYANFKHGDNSIYSINIALIENFEGEEFEYFIAGEDELTTHEALQHEAIVLGSWYGDSSEI